MIEKTALNYDEIVALAIEEAIEIGDLASDVEEGLKTASILFQSNENNRMGQARCDGECVCIRRGRCNLAQFRKIETLAI